MWIMSRRSGLDAVIRGFTWTAVVGGVIVVVALVCGLLRIIAGAVAAGSAYAGLLLFAVGVREITRARRLRAKRLQAKEALGQHEGQSQ
jgi:TRAP-type mannitol/chloroaromatic compound transport system permease large subunit